MFGSFIYRNFFFKEYIDIILLYILCRLTLYFIITRLCIKLKSFNALVYKGVMCWSGSVPWVSLFTHDFLFD